MEQDTPVPDKVKQYHGQRLSGKHFLKTLLEKWGLWLRSVLKKDNSYKYKLN